MKTLIITSSFAFIFFLVIDFAWLTFASKYFYKPLLGPLLLEKPIILPAIIFYFIYILGLSFLVLRPCLENFSVINAAWMGAIFGLVAYGTYDLTNMATLKNWSLNVVIVDMIWGGLLTGTSSSVGIFLAKKVLI